MVETTGADESVVSAVSWPAILAGGVISAALTLVLFSLGAGLGLAVVSPWSDWNLTAVRAATAAGIFAIVVGVMSSAVGGYIAGRLRSRWVGVHTNEIYFRDTAHGLLSWAFATVLGAAVVGTAATSLVSGGVGSASSQVAATDRGANAIDTYVDRLLRPDYAGGESANRTQGRDTSSERAEARRLLMAAGRARGNLAPADSTYLAQMVAARAGLQPATAEARVTEVVNQMKETLNEARKAAAHFALWLTAAMLFGAFAAALAATEGGQLRDGPHTVTR
jgi:hypothetical protein